MDQKLRQKLTLETIAAIKKSTKQDLFIVQAINHIDEMQKTINLHTKRFVEWLGYVLPELSELQSHEQAVIEVSTKSREELLVQLGLHEEESMGIAPKDDDYVQLQLFARMILDLIQTKEKLSLYLESLMDEFCPNMKQIAGVNIGARLVMYAGGLERLAKVPASKIQLYGAEKALFRHLRTGAKSPKYGIIHEHPLVLREGGRAARALADKIAICVKVDYFKGEPIADKFIQELSERFGPWS